MSGDSYDLGRRQFLQATGAGVAGVATLSAGIGRSRAGQVDEAPDEDEYEEILSAMDGEGTEEDPYVVTDVVELQAISGDLAAGYELDNDIDASPTEDWNGGAGFDPIYGPENDEQASNGEQSEEMIQREFSGWLNGNGHEITGLTIDRPEEPGAGLFRVSEGGIVDLTISDASIVGEIAGIVAATNRGGIAEVTVEGTVSGADGVGGVAGGSEGILNEVDASVDVSGEDRVGGLAGESRGTIAESATAGTVDGERFTGGAVGQDSGTLQNTDADVDVTGTYNVGGFAGEVSGTVVGCSAAGSVVGESDVGGFAGENWAELFGSTASGAVEGEENVGGLVGTSYSEIRVCSAHGDVSGTSSVGGVVGWGASGNLVSDVYSVGGVEGEESAGSLVGLLGWEFFNDGETAQLQRGYWSLDATDHDPIGRVETGDGEVTVEEESLEGLEESQFVGEDVTEHMSEFDFDDQWRALTDEMPIPRAQAAAVFEIRDVSTQEIVARQDETFEIEFAVQNSGEWDGTQTIGLIIDDQLFESVEQTLDAGETTQVAFEELDASELPVGNYTFSIQTRNDEVEGTLEIESAPDDTPAPDDDTPDQHGADDADDDGPGFGVGAALTGVGTGAYLLSQRLGEQSTDE